MSKRILLIDLSSIFWQMWHATKDQETGSAVDGTMYKINKYANDYDHVGVCLDSPPYKRKEIFPEYKAQRDAPSELAIGQLVRVKKRIAADGLPLFSVPGWEADDVIATLTEIATTDTDDTVDILTGDKDLCQLINERVSTISTQRGEIFDPPAVYEKFGVSPEKVGDLLALMGDKSDNVPGVPGVGPKTAAALIKEFGGLSAIMEVLKNGDPEERIKPPGVRTKMLSGPTSLIAARDLVRLNSALEIDISPLYADRVPVREDDDPPLPDVIDEPDTDTDMPAVAAEVVQDETPPQAAIVRREQNFSLQLEPQSSTAALKLAHLLFESRLYTKFQTTEAILAVILRGRALGLDATTALDAFHVVEGKPTMSAPLIIGLCLSSPTCEYFDCSETTPEQATWKTKRKNHDQRTYTYTWEMAQRSGVPGKCFGRQSRSGKPSQWDKYPETMLRWRCGCELARMVYPDVVGGLYMPEEIEVVR